MAKRGSTNHMKRLATPKAIPIENKKESKFISRGSSGPHSRKNSVPLGVLLRDVLKIAETSSEIKKILSQRKVKVDQKVRTDFRFPVGLMDYLSFDGDSRMYKVMVDSKGRLAPVSIEKAATTKLLKVTNKNVLKGGKFSLTFHDGKTTLSDNNVKVGDSVVFSFGDSKLKKVLKLANGSRCLIREGKHAGSIVKLKEIIQREGGKPSEAVVTSEDKKEGEFITVAKYLFVVDDEFTLA